MAYLLDQITAQMDNYHWQCQALDRAIQPVRLNPADIVFTQQKYNQLADLQAGFSHNVQEFNDSLCLDEEGDPVLPVNGEPGYRWREEEYRAVLDTIDGTL